MASELMVNLALAGIDDQTCSILRETWPVVRERVPQVLDALYGQGSFRPSLKAPSSEETARMAEARAAQEQHWEALFAARFDEDYAASVSRIALTHVRVGLRPAWFISGYLVALTELHSLLLNAHAEGIVSWRARTRMEQAIRAVDKAVLFDLQLGVSAYFAETEAGYRRRLETMAERHEQAALAANGAETATSDDLGRSAEEVWQAVTAAQAEAASTEQCATQAAAQIAECAETLVQATAMMDQLAAQARAATQAAGGAAALMEGAMRLTEGLGSATRGLSDVAVVLERLTADTGALMAGAVAELGQAGRAVPAVAALAEQVKAFASQIATTTGSLHREIERVQATSASAAGAISEVQTALADVHSSSGAVTAAMGRQMQAAQRIGQANAGLAQSMSGLVNGAGRITSGTAQALAQARGIAAMAQQLRDLAAARVTAARGFAHDLRNADRRADPREPASASVLLSFANREVRGALHDVSRGGASVIVDPSQFPDDPGPVTVRAPHALTAAVARLVGRTERRIRLAFTDPVAAEPFVTSVLDRSASLSAAPRRLAAQDAANHTTLDFAALHHHKSDAPPEAVLCAAIPH